MKKENWGGRNGRQRFGGRFYTVDRGFEVGKIFRKKIKKTREISHFLRGRRSD
ncbi:MAG: hypothetical protein IIW01_04895 [Thermoguttaceae bacterium]|nr:hypothetical protein [Thermoguttaceae bacterium]MBQ5789605.1 hypothetical protein [Thermoguttaceae bacterium]